MKSLWGSWGAPAFAEEREAAAGLDWTRVAVDPPLTLIIFL